MRVDDSTYYIDPTYVCQTGEMDNLKMKNEMERIGDRQYQLEDSFEYQASFTRIYDCCRKEHNLSENNEKLCVG